MTIRPGRAWHETLALLCAEPDAPAFEERLLDGIGGFVGFSSAMIALYEPDKAPVIVHDQLDHPDRQTFQNDYLAGIYLVSPFYAEAMKSPGPMVRRLRDIAPEGFRKSEYYRAYVDRIGFTDLAGLFLPAGHGRTLLVSLGRGREERPFSISDVRRLDDILPMLGHLAPQRWGDRMSEAAGREAHARLSATFESFGKDCLTAREAEVTRLILSGHSSKSIARLISISSETVRVHRRNINAKLGVTSQGELFSRFLGELGLSLPGQ